MGNIKQANVKNRTFYFFKDKINIKDFDSSLLKIDKNLYKNIGIYNIGYITIKKIDDYESITSVNPSYLDGYIENPSQVDGYIEKNNGNKYLVFISADVNKEVLEKYTKIWDGIETSIEKINKKPGEY